MAIVVLFFLINLIFLNLVHSKCPVSFPCGNLGYLEFPLSDINNHKCGLFMVNCSSQPPQIKLDSQGPWYEILQKASVNKFLVRDPYLHKHLEIKQKYCLALYSLFPRDSPSTSFSISPNLTLFLCNGESGNSAGRFESYRNKSCYGVSVYYNRGQRNSSYGDDVIDGLPIPGCKVLHMPVKVEFRDSDDLFDMLTDEFNIEWNVSQECYECHGRGRQCGADKTNQQFLCKSDREKVKWWLWLFVAAGAIVTLLLLSIFMIYLIRKKRKEEGK